MQKRGKKLVPGCVYGYLTVIEEVDGRYYPYLCKCICGKERKVLKQHLLNGHTISCGCRCKRNYKHGYTVGRKSPREYKIWKAMNNRCYSKSNKYYYLYGGMGVRVCDSWRYSFERFYRDMGKKPRGKSLDRYPNKNGDYDLSNCRWATQKQQMNNVRNNVIITYKGITLSQSEWNKKLGRGSGWFTYHLKRGRDIDWIMKRAKKLNNDVQ